MNILETALKLAQGETVSRINMGDRKEMKLIYNSLCDIAGNCEKARKQLHNELNKG